jgi:hypothetical protein
MTPLHARPKAYRNLHNAKRVSNRGGKSEATLDREFAKETAKLIDAGWKAFWNKRGAKKPPYVSSRQIGVFELSDK